MLLHGVRCIHGKANDQKQCISNFVIYTKFLKSCCNFIELVLHLESNVTIEHQS